MKDQLGAMQHMCKTKCTADSVNINVLMTMNNPYTRILLNHSKLEDAVFQMRGTTKTGISIKFLSQVPCTALSGSQSCREVEIPLTKSLQKLKLHLHPIVNHL